MAASKLARVFSGNLEEAFHKCKVVVEDQRHTATHTTVAPAVCKVIPFVSKAHESQEDTHLGAAWRLRWSYLNGNVKDGWNGEDNARMKGRGKRN